MTALRSPLLAIASASLVLNCGALGAPARGDRDLPSTVLGGYAAVALESSPTGSALLLTADDGSIDEPSVIVMPDGRRAVYGTHTTGAGAVRIARAIERSPRYLRFEPIQTVLEAASPWEQGAVRAPSIVRDGATLWLFYEAGGAIGAARSSDGVAFERQSEPVLRADGANAEGAELAAPCVVAHPSGGFVMAYASAGALFFARAAQLPGPWTRVGGGPVASPSALPEGGLEALSDPALVIERTGAGRTLIAMAASARGAGTVTSVVGFAAYESEAAPVLTRADRALYAERVAGVSAGSFDRIDARTMLLWVGRTDRTRSVVGALITPGGLRAGNPFTP